MDEKKNPTPTPHEGETNKGRGGRRGGQNRQRWNNNAAIGSAGKFKGKTPGIEHDIFDNTGYHDAANFHRSLKHIADHLQLTCGNELCEAIRTMTPVFINIPPVPTGKPDPNDSTGTTFLPVDDITIYLWKEQHKKASAKLDKYEIDMARAYIIIFHQCTPSLKNELEATDTFPAVRVSQDPIALLKLIQSLCCSYDAKTQSVMATVASHKRLFTYYQRDNDDNHKYYQEFCAHVETLETYGGIGAVGVTPTFLAAKLKDLAAEKVINDANHPTDAERLVAIKQCRDEFLGCLMLSGANRDRYATLKSDLNNQYGFGKDLYPKSPDLCLSLLNRRSDAPLPRQPRPAAQPPTPVNKEEEALVFAQGATDRKTKSKEDGSTSSPSSSSTKSRDSITTVKCKKCGKFGHISQYCPKKDRDTPPAQIHAMNAIDDASEASDDESVIILSQIHEEFVLTQDAARKTINSDLVLLDSQSTVNLFTNSDHVRNIRPATTPINVHCNKGTLTTTAEADFGDTPVYFDDRGIANVLSLYRLGRKFKVTYDSTDREGVFQVHTKQGIVEFKPTAHGLHALNLKTNPEAAFILVNDADLKLPQSPEHQVHVATVRENYNNFSRKQIDGAKAARRLMGMIATPSTRDFNALVRLNMIPDCPITPENIKHADSLFGPDLATVRGKTVRRKPTRVVTDYVDIPRTLIDINKKVTLAVDVMFVNSVPFLVSVSRTINLITIEHAPKCSATKLGELIHRIARVYARAGFSIQTVLMDNEFEKLKDLVPMLDLNIPAASEHVGEIERKIRVIKERTRGLTSTLPYPRLPKQMLIHLLHFVTMWLNNFPTINGLSPDYSPREIILRNRLSYKRHCRAPFGAYCETHEDNTPTNSMHSRSLPAICLGPTGNFQGSYNFLNLVSGLVIKRRAFHELPAPDSIIARVTALATTSGVSSDLVFADRRRVPFSWSTTPVVPPPVQPMAPYPDVSTEIPGVTLARHTPPLHQPTNVTEPNWEQLADDAADNANLEFTDFLPPPPEVINIDDEEITPTPFTSQLPHQPKIEPPPASPPPLETQAPSLQTQTRYPSRIRRPPQHLAQDYLFTTVAEENKQPPEHSYQTAGGTVVDLALKDECMMAQVCHYVMTHTANSLYCAQDIKPKKKQYSLKAGLREFANRGKDAVTKELTQFHTLKCFKPRDPSTLSREERRNALTSLMFLTEKRSGEIKARACANGSTQRTHIAKEEATAPTVTSEAIFIQGTIFAHEKRDVATCDIPGAFLQADNPDYVLMRLDGILAELMVQVAPSLYRKYITSNAKGKPILYVQLEKAVYGMMKSALLFYRKLVADLTSLGYEINPYDYICELPHPTNC